MALTETEKQKIEQEELSKLNSPAPFVKPKKSLTWLWVILAILFGPSLFFGFVGSISNAINPNQNKAVREQPATTSNSNSKPETVTVSTGEQKEAQILQEQKTKAENLVKTAANLIAENKIAEAMALYNDRWSELTKLRSEVLFDTELTASQRENVGTALKTEQEGIAKVLSVYQKLY